MAGVNRFRGIVESYIDMEAEFMAAIDEEQFSYPSQGFLLDEPLFDEVTSEFSHEDDWNSVNNITLPNQEIPNQENIQSKPCKKEVQEMGKGRQNPYNIERCENNKEIPPAETTLPVEGTTLPVETTLPAEKITTESTSSKSCRISVTLDPSIFDLYHMETNKDDKEKLALLRNNSDSNQADFPVNPSDLSVCIELPEGDDMPILMPNDLTSLLEEFEAATERRDAEPNLPASQERPSTQTVQNEVPQEIPNQIKLELAMEVINEDIGKNLVDAPKQISPCGPLPLDNGIKITSKKNRKKPGKTINPAISKKCKGRTAKGVHKDGAARTKVTQVKLVESTGGELVQLDHDYCFKASVGNSRNISDSSECSSQPSTPDISHSLVTEHKNNLPPVKDTSSRKDESLESEESSGGDINLLVNIKEKEGGDSKVKNFKEMYYSHVKETNKDSVVGCSYKVHKISVVNHETVIVSNSATVIHTPMVSVLKKNIKQKSDVNVSDVNMSDVNVSDSTSRTPNSVLTPAGNNQLEGKKKKLNLAEYRRRRAEHTKLCSQENSITPSEPVLPGETMKAQEGVCTEMRKTAEVQTQTYDCIDLTSSPTSSPTDHSTAKDQLSNRSHMKPSSSYQSRYSSSSTSSSSGDTYQCRSRDRARSRSNKRHRESSYSRKQSRSRSPSTSHYSSSRSSCRSLDGRRDWHSRSPRSPYSSNDHYRYDRSFYNRNTWNHQPPHRSRPDYTSEDNRHDEKRLVVFVGNIQDGTTKTDLRNRFSRFGPIKDISLHFRERRDNYGFVTFTNETHAYNAIEQGNYSGPHYDLCFGNRRDFCKQKYADLDGLATSNNTDHYPAPRTCRPTDSFDYLLQQARAAQLRRPSIVD